MRIQLVFILLSSIPILLQAQNATNGFFNSPQVQADIVKARQMFESSKLKPLTTNEVILTSNSPPKLIPIQKQKVTDSQGQDLTPEEIEEFKARNIDPSTVTILSPTSTITNQSTLFTTPADLRNAGIWMDSFLGVTNATIVADLISIKPELLKFRCYDRNYNYSGHYTVVLNKPRQHKNPYFGFGSPETVKFVILENVGGNTLPLQNAIIWEKSTGFIDLVTLGKEWIYSGTYTIQN